jgi:hypothetical protein
LVFLSGIPNRSDQANDESLQYSADFIFINFLHLQAHQEKFGFQSNSSGFGESKLIN